MRNRLMPHPRKLFGCTALAAIALLVGGHLVVREDIYGRDAKLISLLKSEERRVADQPINDRREASASSSSSGTSSGYTAPRRQVMRQAPSYGFFGLFR